MQLAGTSWAAEQHRRTKALTLCHFCTLIRPEWTSRGECLAALSNAPFISKSAPESQSAGPRYLKYFLPPSFKGVTIKWPMWVDASVRRSRAISSEHITACLIMCNSDPSTERGRFTKAALWSIKKNGIVYKSQIGGYVTFTHRLSTHMAPQFGVNQILP